MIPIHLSLSGFLSYREPVDLDFNHFDVACISGANGAGKSSLLDAITWVLFGQARKRDDSLIHANSETADVSFTFGYEGNVYRVQRIKPRGKTTLLEFHIQGPNGRWKALTERTLRNTETRIESTLRLDYETFVNASFFLQGKADQFTQQRPGDRKRILSSILGLEVWESYRKGSFERRRVLEGQITELDGRLQEINAELAEEETRKKRLKELEGGLKNLSAARAAQETSLEEMRRRAASLAEQEKLVSALAGQLERLTVGQAELGERQNARLAEMQTHQNVANRAKEIEAAYQVWQDTRAELAVWEEVAARFHEHEQRRHAPLTEIETTRARLEAELQTLQNEKAQVDAAQAALIAQNDELVSAQKHVDDLKKQLDERIKLEEQLSAAIKDQAKARAENPLLKKEMEALKERITQLEGTDGAVCPLCGEPLTAEERKNLINELQAEGKQKGDSYRANQKTLAEADQLVSDLEHKIAIFGELDKHLREQTRSVDQLNDSIQRSTEQKEKWEKEGAARLAELSTLIKQDEFAPKARALLAETDAELKKIGYDAALHDKVRKAETEQRTAEGELRALENARAAMAPLEREIKDIQKQIAEQSKLSSEQQGEYDTAAASLAAAQAEAPDVTSAEREMLRLQEEENKLRLEVGAAQQEVLVLEDLKTRRAALETQREEIALQIGRFKALERAFGKDGVPAMLIEQALPQIESKANEVLERLSDGQMSISFITQQAYKDSKRDDMRETLDIQISDSAGIRDYEMFSGGEAFRINFAIRLALSEVLAQRAGARLQTLVIDEGFGSQDAAGRQRLVEAINLVKEDFAKILVITHIDSLRDAFTSRIEVEKTNLGSMVQVV